MLHKPKTNDGKLLEAGASGWFTIFKGAKNIDLAKEMIFELLDPKNFMEMVQTGGGLFLPAYRISGPTMFLRSTPTLPRLRRLIFNPEAYTGMAYPADPNPAIDAVTAQAVQSQMMANVNQR